MDTETVTIPKKLKTDFKKRKSFAVLGLVIGMGIIPLAVYLTQNSQDIRQHASEFSVQAPASRSINWSTPDVTVQATSFYLLVNGQQYFAQAKDVLVTSRKTTPQSTDLLVSWNENNTPIQLQMTFQNIASKSGSFWVVPVVQATIGSGSAAVVPFSGFRGTVNGEAFHTSVLDLTNGPHRYSENVTNTIHFESLAIRIAFPEPTPPLRKNQVGSTSASTKSVRAFPTK